MACNNILHWLFLKLKIQRKVLEKLTLGDDLLVCVAEDLLELLLIGCRAQHEGSGMQKQSPVLHIPVSRRNREQLTPEGT